MRRVWNLCKRLLNLASTAMRETLYEKDKGKPSGTGPPPPPNRDDDPRKLLDDAVPPLPTGTEPGSPAHPSPTLRNTSLETESTTIGQGAATSQTSESHELLPENTEDRYSRLVKELTKLIRALDVRRVEGGKTDAAADKMISEIQEILARSGVEVISGDMTYVRSRHQPIGITSLPSEGAPIAETLYPGFAIGRRVVLRAKVRLAATS